MHQAIDQHIQLIDHTTIDSITNIETVHQDCITQLEALCSNTYTHPHHPDEATTHHSSHKPSISPHNRWGVHQDDAYTHSPSNHLPHAKRDRWGNINQHPNLNTSPAYYQPSHQDRFPQPNHGIHKSQQG
jgi:hypothetical protein